MLLKDNGHWDIKYMVVVDVLIKYKERQQMFSKYENMYIKHMLRKVAFNAL